MSDINVPPPPRMPPPPPAHLPPPPGGASSNRGVMIALSYLWILALIPFLTEKHDQEVRWHAKHGLVLLGVEIVINILFTVASIFIGFVSDSAGCLFSLVWPIFWLAVLAFHIACIVQGLNGQRLKIPGVSDFADKF